MDEFIRALPVSRSSLSDNEIAARIHAGPPTTAEDYLMRVRWEASKLPEVCIASTASKRNSMAKPLRKYSEENASVTYETSMRSPNSLSKDRHQKNSSSLVSSPVWQTELLSNFVGLRDHLQLSFIKVVNKPGVDDLQKQRKDLPGTSENDCNAWIEFCFGSLAVRTFTNNKNNNANDHLGHAPSTSLIMCMDNFTTSRVLYFHVKSAIDRWTDYKSLPLYEDFSDTSKPSPSESRRIMLGRSRIVWIYSLLVNINKHLQPEVKVCLQQLLELCYAQRESLFGVRLGLGLQNDSSSVQKPHNWRLASLNVVIVLIESFFGVLCK